MEKLEKASRKWWFFVILMAAQSVLLPIVSRNFDPQNIPRIVSVTLGNAVQNHLGNLNIYLSWRNGLESAAFLHKEYGDGFLPDDTVVFDDSDFKSAKSRHRDLQNHSHYRCYHRAI